MKKIDFGQIIAAKRKEKKLSQPRLAELLKEEGIDIKATSISKWEKNINLPNVLQFLALCEVLEIEDVNATFDILTDKNLYAQLNDEGKEKVQEYMQLLLDSGKYRKERPIEPIPFRPRQKMRSNNYLEDRSKYNLFDFPVSAGTGSFLDSDSDSYEEIETDSTVPYNADFAVRVSGDSMEPRFVDRQIVWIHKQDTLEDGEIGIFYLDGEAFIKKYHLTDCGIELISLNKKYDPIPVKEEMVFQIYGKVVG